QRVAIGRALLSSPRLLVMDEPLASLDAPRKNEILPFIERLRDHMDMPVVYVSHALEEIIRLSDTMVLLSGGKVAATGPVEELTARLDLYPMTGRYEAGAVLATKIAEHDDEFGLSYLDFAGGRLTVPRVDLPVGSGIKLRIRARDVSLSLHRVENTSILNTLFGTIVEINDQGGPQLDIALLVGESRILARVTRKAASLLSLEAGKPIYALMKAVAIDRRSMGRSGSLSRVAETEKPAASDH
ncbi:MAG: TOBE domain-containing protein, partial [Rhodospirillales bacterium]|nr:TOBE domain-containing protein [Rhodospirillales bacterium]